jgi:predicted site-specific integrase-resolvase
MAEYLKPSEVSNLLRVSVHTLKKWRQNKQGVKYIQISRKTILYKVSDIEDWLETQNLKQR